MIRHLINNIALVLDSSSSMSKLSEEVIQVFDDQIKYLARKSTEENQETRVSVYLFGSTVKCLIFDRDVLRLPSIKDFYKTDGMTALIDGALTAIGDLKQMPDLYSDKMDRAHLIYVLSDGFENNSRNSPVILANTINQLSDNWTVAVFVPDERGRKEAKRFGFPENNIETWSVKRKIDGLTL